MVGDQVGDLPAHDLLVEEALDHRRHVRPRALLLVDEHEGVGDDDEEDVHQHEDDEDCEGAEEQRRQHAVGPVELVVVEDAKHELEEREQRRADRREAATCRPKAM